MNKRGLALNLDQLIGSILFNDISPDETIWAYCWRKQYTNRIKILDFFFGKNHCEESYLSEKNQLHLDEEYRK